jgi:hypothetical protein
VGIAALGVGVAIEFVLGCDPVWLRLALDTPPA